MDVFRRLSHNEGYGRGGSTCKTGVGGASIVFCVLIGLVFGGYPAAKASRLQPIEALRSA